MSLWTRGRPGESTSALVYTDRSVYRPLQKVLWKVVAYRGRGEGEFRVAPATTVSSRSHDANGQAVESKTVTTNAFGSAAGEFAIPAGRAARRVERALRSAAARPRPRRGVQAPDVRGDARGAGGGPAPEPAGHAPRRGALLLRPAGRERERALARDARAGLPVVVVVVGARARAARDGGAGQRRARRRRDLRGHVHAEGRRAAGEGGSRTATACPPTSPTRAARRARPTGPSASGSSRSRRDRDRRGVSSSTEEAGWRRIVRTDLDGAPRAGKGTWRLLRLVLAGEDLLPADLPADRTPPMRRRRGRAADVATPGDRLRPRWETATPPRSAAGWKDGAERARGTLEHDEKGEAVLEPALPAGAYRLRYETLDDFGATVRNGEGFLVAGARRRPFAAGVLLVERSSVPVGGAARLLVGSGFRDQPLFLDVFRRAGRPSGASDAGRDPVVIEIPIDESDRGGFGFDADRRARPPASSSRRDVPCRGTTRSSRSRSRPSATASGRARRRRGASP